MHRFDAGIPPVSSTAMPCASAANVAARFASAEAAGCATVESQRGKVPSDGGMENTLWSRSSGLTSLIGSFYQRKSPRHHVLSAASSL